MSQLFDDLYAQYQVLLAKLDSTYDITEKNLLFKRLADQLTELERCIADRDSDPPEAPWEDS